MDMMIASFLSEVLFFLPVAVVAYRALKGEE